MTGVELTQAERDAGVYPGGVTWLSDKAVAEIVAARVASVVEEQDRTLKFYDQINAERIAAVAEVARLTAERDRECDRADYLNVEIVATRAENRRLTALVEAVRESASHPHMGPNDTDASMLRSAAKRLRGGYEPGGSHTKQTVANVITAVADLIDGGAS